MQGNCAGQQQWTVMSRNLRDGRRARAAETACAAAEAENVKLRRELPSCLCHGLPGELPLWLAALPARVASWAQNRSLALFLSDTAHEASAGRRLAVWSAQTGVCMLVHARARTKTRGNPDRGTRPLRHLRTGTPRCSLASSGIQSCSRHCDGSLRAKTRSHPTFLAIVLASSSNMASTPLPGRLQQTRSAAVVLGGESTKCLT